MHPGAWVVWAVSAGLVAMLTINPLYLAPLYAAAVVVYAARRRADVAARAFRIFVIIGIGAVVVRILLGVLGAYATGAPVTRGTIATALLEGFRLAVLLAVFGAFNSVMDPFALIKVAPRRWHEPALAGALALSLAPRTIAAAAQVREAQMLRGIDVRRWRSLVALAVPVLESGMERAVTLAETMDARGHARGPRSRYRARRFDPSSWIVVATTAGGFAAFGITAVVGEAHLGVQTFPLELPTASPLLIAAIAAFAVPAFVPEPSER